jgi:CIC family chloride channel protein
VQRTFIVTLLVGASCGVVAVMFHVAIQVADTLMIRQAEAAPGGWWVFATIACPTLGGLLVGAALQYFPEARGSGVPQLKAAYALQTNRLRLRDALAKFVLTTVQLGSGASLGREGPTVQICAAQATALGRFFSLSPRSVRRLLPVGAAAGVAAAFNAPIAAVTFTVEEVVGGLDQTVLSGVVVAAALAAVIEHVILGENPIFNVSRAVGLHDWSALLFYALLGLLSGVVAVGFSRSLLALRGRFASLERYPAWAKPALGGMVTGCCAVIGIALVRSGGVAGGGYTQLGDALNGQLPIVTLLVLGGLKLVATVFSYASGGTGGLFAPALFVGAMLGGSVGFLDRLAFNHSEVGEFALVGMGAVFAGVIRAPITSIMIIFEMTGGYGLVLPLMIANTMAYGVARRLDRRPLYDALLHQDGVRLPHREAALGRLEGLRVSDAMTANVEVIPSDRDAEQALAAMSRRPFSAYPVIDQSERCLGLVNPPRIRRVIAEGRPETLVTQLVRLKEYLYRDDPLLRAVVRMNALGTRQLPVVEPGTLRLRGILSMSDIFEAQARAADGGDAAQSSTRRGEL